MIRVQIAASGITRAGIESLLRSSPDIQIVAAGADVIIAENEPPQALADSAAAVIVLTDEPQWTTEALRAGVRALLPRDERGRCLAAHVHFGDLCRSSENAVCFFADAALKRLQYPPWECHGARA